MIKIIYVPEWLRASLNADGLPVGVLSDKEITSTIISAEDIKNYYAAQYGFLMAIIPNLREVSYEDMMVHVPKPEIKQELAISKRIGPDRLRYIEKLDFTYYISADGKVAYVVATPCEDTTPDPVIFQNILKLAHNSIRVLDGYVDKSTVFRENPLLSKAYLESLMF